MPESEKPIALVCIARSLIRRFQTCTVPVLNMVSAEVTLNFWLNISNSYNYAVLNKRHKFSIHANKVILAGVFILWKSLQACDSSAVPSSPIQSCLISTEFVSSRVCDRWPHTLSPLSISFATAFSYASFVSFQAFLSLFTSSLSIV